MDSKHKFLQKSRRIDPEASVDVDACLEHTIQHDSLVPPAYRYLVGSTCQRTFPTVPRSRRLHSCRPCWTHMSSNEC
jgi:hypothetical protein